MATSNIKYLLIGNKDTAKVVTEFVVIKNDKFQSDAIQIFEKLSKAKDKKIDQRNKISQPIGNYYFTTVSPNVFFLALVDVNYPERFIFELFENINKDHVPLMINDQGELNASGRQLLRSLVDQYQEPKNKINDIHNDVNEIKLEMKDNIKKIMVNVDDARKLQDSSDKIKKDASDYKKNATELKRATWWQNCKLTIIIVGVIALLLVIILPITLTK
jgi:hypothetical protein